MDDGLFQLFFIVVLVIASILDATTRSRKKRRRMEEMEQEESSVDTESPVPLETRGERVETRGERIESDPGREDWISAGEADEESWMEEGDVSDPEPRETADAMVPADLWAILTGQPSPPQPVPEPSHVPEPVPDDRFQDRPRTSRPVEADIDPPSEPTPVTRRSARWMEGLGGRSSDSGWQDESETESLLGEGIAEPWEDIPDIAVGEIGEDAGDALTDEGLTRMDSVALPTTRKRPPSHYAPIFEAGGIDALRRAVVLKEVLDAPLGLRGPSGGWEDR